MQKKYIIEGGYPLKGKIRANGNKNAALPLIAAAILTDEEVVLRNVPDIEDIRVMLEISRQLGISVTYENANTIRLKGSANNTKISTDLGKKARGSILFAGPMLARYGEVQLPPPGGDRIGRRRLDTHIYALTELGAKVDIDGFIKFKARKLTGKPVFLDEASVTGTENAVMASVLAGGETAISNAACEPHVQDLCNFLVSMGAQIEGIGSNLLRIKGVKKLHGTDFKIGSDYMEVGSFIGLAAVTKSELEILNAQPENMRMSGFAFGKLGVKWETDGKSIFVPSKQELKVVHDIGDKIPKIDDHTWPGFPADLISIIVVTATQVKGAVLIYEKMYESRMVWVDRLIEMGAKIVPCDPHRVVVTGPSRLRGLDLTSPDIRAGMALVLAAFCAEGKSTIQNVIQIERGYENLPVRLKELGARIEEVND